jgi:multidrug efflux pump subunit AcrA (membrane-fusion protein)
MIFRTKALQAYRDPVSKGGLLEIAPAWTLALYVALTVVILIGAGILVFGQAAVSVRGPGLVRPEGGSVLVVASRAGYVERLSIAEGKDLARGAELASFTDPMLMGQLRRQEELVRRLRSSPAESSNPGDAGPQNPLHDQVATEERQLDLLRAQWDQLRLRSPAQGRVVHLHVRVGEYVAEGAPVATVIPSNKPLVGYVAMREKDRPRLQPGAKMRLKFDAYPSQEMGFGTGTIRTVGQDLLTESWDKVFSSITGAPMLPSVLVEVSLDEMPSQAKGRFENGMVFTGEVVVGQQAIGAMLL